MCFAIVFVVYVLPGIYLANRDYEDERSQKPLYHSKECS